MSEYSLNTSTPKPKDNSNGSIENSANESSEKRVRIENNDKVQSKTKR